MWIYSPSKLDEKQRRIVQGTIVYSSKRKQYHALRLEHFLGKCRILFLLIQNSEQKIQIIDFLCKYFIRRNVTDYPNTRNLTNYFIEIIEELNSFESYDFDKAKEVFLRIGRPANDSQFAEKLNGNINDYFSILDLQIGQL